MASLTALCLLSSAIGAALAQTPLINVRQAWPYAGPAQVDTTNGPRGIMTGTNRCTTSNQTSLCVNAVVNSISDFCLYAPPEPNSVIANVEGEAVAWCTTGKYGTRIIPAGAITGLSVITTPGYIVVAGNINGPLLNIQTSDQGGELDPHGADQRGNPIGSLMYTNAFGNAPTGENQVIEWHEFISGTQFCLKACLATTVGDQNLCDNVHDTVGCNVNVPLNYAGIGTSFTQCKGDNQLPPASNLGASVFTPSSSQCTTYTSSVIFAAGASIAGGASSSAAVSSSAVLSSAASGVTSAASTRTGSMSMSTGAATSSVSRQSGAAAPTGVPRAGLAMAAGAVALFAVAR